MKFLKPLFFLAASLVTSTGAFAQITYGPTSNYSGFASSPFSGISGFSYFYLENFDDNVFTPGWISNSGWETTAIGQDSVEAGGMTYYSGFVAGNSLLNIIFNKNALGGLLPTHVGIVWTDSGYNQVTSSNAYGYTPVLFKALDSNNNVIASVSSNGLLGNGTPSRYQPGYTFFGISSDVGIASILMFTESRDWEVDHLQYGYLPPETRGSAVPEPSTYGAVGAVLLGLAAYRRRRAMQR